MKTVFSVLFILQTFYSVPLFANGVPDYSREERIATQIEPGIFDGEVVWLDANDRKFLSIYMPGDEAKGAIILLHGRDVSPEEQNLIGPLRVGLWEQGWTTLALQMPVLEKGAKYYDYLSIMQFAHERIEAAMAFLQSEGEDKIILASHSCGAHMTNDWLNIVGDSEISGYIAMGVGATDAGQDLQTPVPFGDMTVPILDIYGSEEFPRPLSTVPMRQQLLLKNGNMSSMQIEVPGANHYFTDYGDTMIEIVGEWLSEASFEQ